MDGMRVLGAPVGTPNFVQTFVSDTLNEYRKDIDGILHLYKPSAYTLLKMCINQRPNFLRRCTPRRSEVESLFNGFDHSVVVTLEKIIGRSSPLDASDKIARGLPSRMGWPGIYRHGGHRGEIQSIQGDIITLRHITTYYPHLAHYVENEITELLGNEHVSENEMLHEQSDDIDAGTDPDKREISYNFKKYLDMLDHRGKAELMNLRAARKDWKALSWANGQHSPECGSWLKGRAHDFYPFPNSHSYF